MVSLCSYWEVYGIRFADCLGVTWNRRFDYERFSSPTKGLAHGFSTAPTVTLREAEVPLVTLNSQLLSLQQISAPLTIDRSVVLDGEQFGAVAGSR